MAGNFKQGDRVHVAIPAEVVEPIGDLTLVRFNLGDGLCSESLVLTSALTLAPPTPTPGQRAYEEHWGLNPGESGRWENVDSYTRQRWDRIAQAARQT